MLELSDKGLDMYYSNAPTRKAKISSKEHTPMSTKIISCPINVQSGTSMVLYLLFRFSVSWVGLLELDPGMTTSATSKSL